jgi:hypothetical protein
MTHSAQWCVSILIEHINITPILHDLCHVVSLLDRVEYRVGFGWRELSQLQVRVTLVAKEGLEALNMGDLVVVIEDLPDRDAH